MPLLEVVPRSEAELRSASKARAEALGQYVDFIQGLKADQAGKLEASAGDTARTVRRRLGDVGRLIGKELVIKKDGEVAISGLRPSSVGGHAKIDL